MVMPKCLIAAAVIALSISSACACDDYPDEMALAQAQRESELARVTAQQPTTSAEAATTASATPAPTAAPATVDSVDAKAPPAAQTAQTSTGTVRQ